ncbi:MAG: nucleotidyltransferase family protein [Thermomicrobiales bacterium]
MATASELSPEEMASYRDGARRRHEAEQRALAAREERAWVLARRVAARLRQQFPAGRIVVFGSLVHPGCFTPWSDVDIAVWGLRPEHTFRAIGVAMDAGAEIAVNLVDVACCSTSLLRVIEQEGVPI